MSFARVPPFLVLAAAGAVVRRGGAAALCGVVGQVPAGAEAVVGAAGGGVGEEGVGGDNEAEAFEAGCVWGCAGEEVVLVAVGVVEFREF